MKAFILFSLVLVSVAGCAVFPQSSDQVVRIELQPAVSGYCLLQNERGSWVLQNAPGNIDVLRGSHPLYVDCYGTLGARGESIVGSHASFAATIGMDPGSSVVGSNTVASGIPLTGNPYDQYDGAFVAYPSFITVPMVMPETAVAASVSPLPVPPPVLPAPIHRVYRHHQFVPVCQPTDVGRAS